MSLKAAHGCTSTDSDAGLIGRVVVWSDPGNPEATAALLRGLAQRRAPARAVAHPARVMVELARGGRVLVIDRPSQRCDVDRLLNAVRRHYRHVSCWSFEPASADRSARLEKIHPPVQPDLSADAPQTDGEALISREELAMLLGPYGDES